MSRFIQLVKTEPALFTGAVQAVLALIAGTGLNLTAAQSGAVLAATTAVLALIAAAATRPFQVSALTGVVTVAGTLAVAFGVKNADPGLVASVNGVIVAAFAFFGIRPQVTPVASLSKPPPAAPSIIPPSPQKL